MDEAQDIGVAELRFLAALGAGRPDALFFAADLGRRIFQTPFSWRALGVDSRGRSHTLRVNSRTSHQIRRQADRLLLPGGPPADPGGPADRRTPADRRPVENTPASWLDWLTVRSAHMVQPRMLSHH